MQKKLKKGKSLKKLVQKVLTKDYKKKFSKIINNKSKDSLNKDQELKTGKFLIRDMI